MTTFLRWLFPRATQVAAAAVAEIDEERQLAEQRERLMCAAAAQTLTERVNARMCEATYSRYVPANTQPATSEVSSC